VAAQGRAIINSLLWLGWLESKPLWSSHLSLTCQETYEHTPPSARILFSLGWSLFVIGFGYVGMRAGMQLGGRCTLRDLTLLDIVLAAIVGEIPGRAPVVGKETVAEVVAVLAVCLADRRLHHRRRQHYCPSKWGSHEVRY
jgi:hypothetical protein